MSIGRVPDDCEYLPVYTTASKQTKRRQRTEDLVLVAATNRRGTGLDRMNTSNIQNDTDKSQEKPELLQPALLMGLVLAWVKGTDKEVGKMPDKELTQGLELRLYSSVIRHYLFAYCRSCNQWAERMDEDTYDHAELSDIKKVIEAGCFVQVLFRNTPVVVWTSWKEFVVQMISGSPKQP